MLNLREDTNFLSEMKEIDHVKFSKKYDPFLVFSHKYIVKNKLVHKNALYLELVIEESMKEKVRNAENYMNLIMK